MRIGFGYDVHKLVTGREFILGGVKIPFEYGLLGHSDADVLIHSLIDAIIGALGKGDIGVLFPDSDKTFKGIDSRILLRDVCQMMHEQNYCLVNCDSTICTQRPKLRDYIEEMRKNIAGDLRTQVSNISIKATTEEGLGISGSNMGVTAYSVVLITEQKV